MTWSVPLPRESASSFVVVRCFAIVFLAWLSLVWGRVTFCSTGWGVTHRSSSLPSVCSEPPASVSPVLGLQKQNITPSPICLHQEYFFWILLTLLLPTTTTIYCKNSVIFCFLIQETLMRLRLFWHLSYFIIPELLKMKGHFLTLFIHLLNRF